MLVLMTEPKTPERLLDDKELVERGVAALWTLRKWRVEKKGPPFVHVGRRVKYPESDFIRWMASLPRQGDAI